ncbi:hypothetical protein, partial [Nocardia xishanensis]
MAVLVGEQRQLRAAARMRGGGSRGVVRDDDRLVGIAVGRGPPSMPRRCSSRAAISPAMPAPITA